MATKSKFKSDACEAIHSSISAMYRIGTIDKATMREFDLSCLENPGFDAEDIKLLREENELSQRRFARQLSVSESTVQKWETGAKRPSGPSLKLLSVVKKHGLGVLS